MKAIALFLLVTSSHSFGQMIEKLKPDTMYSNPMFIGPDRIKSFNSDESIAKCEKIYAKLELENRKATKAENRILKNCNECSETPWDVPLCCSWYCGGGVDSIYASSTLPNQGKYSYDAKNCHDLNYKTPWVEGAEGYGIGESITYSFRAETPRITHIIITNGYVISEDAWFENSRVKTLKIYLNDEEFAILHLKDTKNDQVFHFDPIGTSDRSDWDKMKTLPDWTMKFEIVEVYEGDLYEDTAISEIYFDGIDVH